LDTGQVLIESACSVERVEETLDTLIPMLPEMQYFRFNPGKLTSKEGQLRLTNINIIISVV
jgi:hypothetical protein